MWKNRKLKSIENKVQRIEQFFHSTLMSHIKYHPEKLETMWKIIQYFGALYFKLWYLKQQNINNEKIWLNEMKKLNI